MPKFSDTLHAEFEEADRDRRQAQLAEWAEAAFGSEHAKSIPQRGVRMLEEAIEAAQAAGVDLVMAHKLLDFVYGRPVGELRQELGGLALTTLLLAHSAGASAEAEERRELARVMSKPPEHFRARNEAKNVAGFNYTNPAEAVADKIAGWVGIPKPKTP